MAEYSPMELAEAFIRAGELADALTALNQHLDQHPDDENARRMRVSVLVRTPLIDPSAESAFNTALADLNALSSHTLEDVIQRYQLLFRIGTPAAAHQTLLDAFARGDSVGRDPRLIDLLLEGLYQRGDATTAIHLLFDLPKTWHWLRWNGDFHALKGDYRVALDYYCSALDTFDEATQDPPQSAAGFVGNLRAQILLRRAEMFERLSLFAEAEADLAEAETLSPGDPVIQFRRGLVVYLSGAHERGIDLCKAAFAQAKPGAIRDSLTILLNADTRYSALIAVLGI